MKKTLLDMVKKWKVNLHVCFTPIRNDWQACIPMTMVKRADGADEFVFGEGMSVSEAIEDLHQKLRGQNVNFGSMKYPDYEIVPTDLRKLDIA